MCDKRSPFLSLASIIIYRQDTVVSQSQEVQKSPSLLQELPYEFFCGKAIPVLKMWSFLQAYKEPKGDSTHFSDVDLLCTGMKNDEIPRTFPNSHNFPATQRMSMESLIQRISR